MRSTLIEDFLGYMKSIKNCSALTIDEYRYVLELFLSYMVARKKYHLSSKEISEQLSLESENKFDISDLNIKFIEKIDLQDLYSYISYLDIYRNNGPSTRARKIISIRSFFGYYYKQIGLLSENVAEKLESPKIGKKNPVYLTLDECYKLLNTVLNYEGSKFIKFRDFAIIVLFLNTGMRLSELSSINTSSIKSDSLTVLGKGNKERTIYLNKACLSALSDYHDVRPITKDPALFLSTRKKRMSNRAIQSRIEFHLKSAGFDTTIYSTHKLRHTAATLMYKYGSVDIRALQQILGHESVSTTEIYTHLDDETLRKAVRKNPLSEFDVK